MITANSFDENGTKSGWTDKRSGKDFPADFDMKSTSYQISYSYARQISVINSTILSFPGMQNFTTLVRVAKRNGGIV